MEISVILPHIEALIFASEKPLTSLELTELTNNALGFLDDKITLDQVEAAVLGVIEKYDADFYPFEIRESGGGWQFLTKKEFHKTVAQLNGDKFLKRLSAASLETLAIIAYKQPITKGEVESIRGVNSDYSIQKLLEKELIIITGRNEDLPGKPLVYATSKTFMDYFGINSPDELPVIKEILSSQPFSATPVPSASNEGLFKDQPVDEEHNENIERAVSAEANSEAPVDGEPNESAEQAVSEEPDEISVEQNERSDEPVDAEPGNPVNKELHDNTVEVAEHIAQPVGAEPLEDDNDPLIIRGNGELTEEPELVIEGVTEVVEPEQVIEDPQEPVGETGDPVPVNMIDDIPRPGEETDQTQVSKRDEDKDADIS